MTKLDLNQLKLEIQNLKYDQKLYKVLKDELSAIGHWKAKPRGNPAKGYRIATEARSTADGDNYQY